MTRRTLLQRATQAIGLVLAAIVGLPAAVTVLSPAFVPRRPRWRAIGPVEEFPKNRARAAVVDTSGDGWAEHVEPRSVFVRRMDDDQVLVLSRSCTDLGCPLAYDPGSDCFLCPCHGGIFDAHGRRMAGPPPAPMRRYQVRVRGGNVEIDLNSVPPMS